MVGKKKTNFVFFTLSVIVNNEYVRLNYDIYKYSNIIKHFSIHSIYTSNWFPHM